MQNIQRILPKNARIHKSIELPTNHQFLNSSEHVKWSLLNLRNIRKRKFCIILGEKYLVIHVQVPSWHPQQHICHLQKSEPSLYDSLTNNVHFNKRVHPHQTTGYKVLGFAEKIALFAHRVPLYFFWNWNFSKVLLVLVRTAAKQIQTHILQFPFYFFMSL